MSCDLVAETNLTNPGELGMHPLVECSGEDRVGDDHIQRRQSGDSRQQIPVHRIQAIRIKGAVADRHDDVTPRTRRDFGEQSLTPREPAHTADTAEQ